MLSSHYIFKQSTTTQNKSKGEEKSSMKVISKTKFLSFMTFVAFFKSYIRKDIDETITKVEEFRSDVLDDIHTHVPDLVNSLGYPIEEHSIQSQDGYIITMHRIPHGFPIEQGQDSNPRPVVLLAHCMMASSVVFTFGPTNHSLAYLLADEGYDVWMMNVRGNQYSQGHVDLDKDLPSDSKKYWSFGIDEPARYDYPVAIDYILNKTSQEDLYYIGYSMGTSHYFIMLSELPEYNEKIKAAFVMGPAVFVGNNLLKLGKPLYDYMFLAMDFLGINQLFPKSLADLSHYACTKDNNHAGYCHWIWNLIATSDEQDLDMKTSLTQMTNFPSGSSAKTFKHYAQLLDGKFTKYSYDSKTNMKLYGSKTAPEYNLKNVKVPTRIIVGQSDPLSTVEGAKKLSEVLPNSMGYHVVEKPEWNHIDFAFSNHVRGLVFNQLISELNCFKNSTATECKAKLSSQTSSNTSWWQLFTK